MILDVTFGVDIKGKKAGQNSSGNIGFLLVF